MQDAAFEKVENRHFPTELALWASLRPFNLLCAPQLLSKHPDGSTL